MYFHNSLRNRFRSIVVYQHIEHCKHSMIVLIPQFTLLMPIFSLLILKD